jgi:CRP/FNR family transcriptional regulator, cyclic AMP receptor protein
MIHKTDDFIKISQSIPFLSCITTPELEEIERTIIIKTFAKNEVILLEEDQSDFFYIIFSGKVKVTQMNESGKELLLAIHKRGNYFGEMSMMDGKTAPANIIAMENSKIGFFTRNNFVKYIIKNEKCMQTMVSLLCSRLRDAWISLKLHSYSDAGDRLRAALNIFYQKFGMSDARGKIINTKLSHKDLASFAAMSRETASRIISSLLKSKEIDMVDNKYIRLKPAFFEHAPSL